MKNCPKCNRTYSDPDLNFCLEDGELLMTMSSDPFQRPYADDPPPTVIMDQARITNPVSWSNQAQPPMQWQPQQLASVPSSPNQTLGIVSLILGVSSVTVGWCCWIGVLLGPAAIVTGVIGLSQIKNDPRTYGGKGLAIAGIIAGILYLILAALLFIVSMLGSAFN
ncbi:MAG: DUF4190 domain-containing protein [Acidobacteria bacterium]|nr:DUF4190 domain-containing protein [Acidobacteriota bacterium]MCW5949071.1 DUF4190 domain-containing protein [Pyrinomonadaceae bacterium]